MCGIFGLVGGKKDAAQVIIKGLKKLEYRGYDSWGIAVKSNGKIRIERHLGKIGQAKTKLPQSNIGLGHTRWATHGGVTIGNTHPHLNFQKNLCLVHNGIVENFRPLKEKLLKTYQFSSETDTEVALHLIEENHKKMSLLKAVKKTFKQIHGMNALIVLDSNKNELVAVKNGSPLTIGLTKDATYISSDVWSLLDHTSKVIFMEDNQLAHLTAGQVSIINLKTNKKIKPKITKLNWQSEQSRLGKFHHYMQKEIADQPKVLDNLSRLDPDTLSLTINSIQNSAETYLLGCGTAYYAALFGEYLFNLNGIKAKSIIGSEFIKYKKLLSKQDVFLMLSQSGETIDVVEAVNLAKSKKMKVMCLTNVLGSTLYRKSDHQILLQAGQEVAVASTKAFTAKLAILIQLVYLKAGNLKLGQKLISQSAKAITKILENSYQKKLINLVKKLKDQDRIFVIGRQLSYPIALETALKIKEVSYIHAEGYAGGELKHGPIALIDQGTPCIVIAPLDETFTDIISAAYELKARGGFIIGISPKSDPVFDTHLKVKDLKEATAIINTVVAQSLAYYLAIARGLNPDKPRNLAKSVTVK
ncbi:MAG: glutamine--fructose-6-phosphate transaminase (isomerizing) [Candidatus Beckwithbacteria bacterium]|nr:glutamine--fructose-6-phosphate transaminase (isomerizing) [Patescibacteria group bacterium]